MLDVRSDARLETIGRRIERLPADAAARAYARIRRQLDLIRERELAGASLLREACDRSFQAIYGLADELDYRLKLLELELDIAEASLARERARSAEALSAALVRELDGWDAYLERLQLRATRKSGEQRDEAEQAIRRLRGYRNGLARCLADLRSADDDAWREIGSAATLVRSELEEAVDASAREFD
jgi:hypothetical protein